MNSNTENDTPTFIMGAAAQSVPKRTLPTTKQPLPNSGRGLSQRTLTGRTVPMATGAAAVTSALTNTPSSAESIDGNLPLRNRVLELLGRRDVHSPIVIAEVGSVAHGISIAEDPDHDYIVVRMETWTEFVNGPGDRQSMMVRTQPDHTRSGPGDIDLQVYTLRKFTYLAMNCNPSILAAIWTPENLYVWPQWERTAKKLKEITPCTDAGQAFMGYMRQQMMKWRGGSSKNVNRTELIEAYGYDVKYAAQIIKLGHQGIRFMEEGIMEIPISEPVATEIKSLRTGGYTESQAFDWAVGTEVRLKDAIRKSKLPDHSDKRAAALMLALIYGDHYGPELRNE